MRRLSLWMRAHPMAGDSFIALMLLFIDLLMILAGAVGDEPDTVDLGPWFLSVPLAFTLTLALLFRRKSPIWSAYVIVVIGTVQGTFPLGISGGIAMAISLYSMVVYVGRKQGLVYLLVLFLSTAFTFVLQKPDDVVFQSVVIVFATALCWALGEFVGARRAYDEEVEARLHLLETERDQATRLAVGEERGRIARELHDVVAHAVSVMVVQADGASYTMESNPEMAQRALHTISETGRGALNELRRLLDVLRNDHGDAEPRVPQPDAHALADLAERMREAGVPVRLEMGPLGDLPAGVSLGVYRIVQESLTNTLKHAGRGATAEVWVRREDNTVEVLVRDDGAGRAAELVPATGAKPRTAPSRVPVPGGNGLIGMRERANVFGGNLDVGPVPGGGWLVRATLPVRLSS